MSGTAPRWFPISSSGGTGLCGCFQTNTPAQLLPPAAPCSSRAWPPGEEAESKSKRTAHLSGAESWAPAERMDTLGDIWNIRRHHHINTTGEELFQTSQSRWCELEQHDGRDSSSQICCTRAGKQEQIQEEEEEVQRLLSGLKQQSTTTSGISK